MSALLILGTSSGAGKSTLVAGLCRWLARQGRRVAPFKAQNMSLNSYVGIDGGELGRAQALQAWAAGIEPDTRMNPILLKPGSPTRSQLVVRGQPAGELEARSWARRGALAPVVAAAFAELREEYDVVICEGAGSPAEINLRASDLVNLGFARAHGVPALLVADIDRGGAFAALTGTLAVLEPRDQDLVRGFVLNRFRGDPALLGDGLEHLARLTGRPTLGVVPELPGRELDTEDRTDWGSFGGGAPPRGLDSLRVGVVMLPYASNLTDLDALALEPGVRVRPLWWPAEADDCDLVIVPGSRATVADLTWLRARGFDAVLARRAAAGRPVLGICAGYQMLGRVIDDPIESGAGQVAGLGLLPVTTAFTPTKVVARTRAVVAGSPVTGYQIHHGRVTREGGDPLLADEGCRVGAVAGTTWHGLFEADAWRRSYLAGVAAAAGRSFVADPTTDFAAARAARLDALADAVDQHLDTDAVERLLEGSGPVPRRVRLTRQPAPPGAA